MPAEKTNVMRILEQRGIQFKSYTYGNGEPMSGTDVAALLGQDPDRVFKTLVTQGHSGTHYVFMVPVAEELDLRKAASAVGEKSIAMIKSRELLPLTGYVHGGCSPIGMKKAFPTWIHESAAEADIICVSAGRVGAQIELKTDDLCRAAACRLADLV